MVIINTTIQWNPTLRPLLLYSHLIITAILFWPEQKLSQLFSYFKNPFNTATPFIRPDFCVPLVTRLTGFHCTIMYSTIPKVFSGWSGNSFVVVTELQMISDVKSKGT